MSITPIITFKAGACDFDPSASPPKVQPKPTPGYIYLFEEDELIQFCWRPRSAPMSSPELKLSMFPTDGKFVPYKGKEASSSESTKSPTNGRIYVLKFESSGARHLFWLQSKSQHSQGDASWFSPRDLKLGALVNQLLQGEEVDVSEELATVPGSQGHDGSGGGDTEMEDARPEGSEDVHGNLGGGAIGEGNQENEGSESRDGGADGGRAANNPNLDAEAAVRNFLQSLQGSTSLQNQSQPQSQAQGKPYTTLPELLATSTTIPVIDTASEPTLNSLLSFLPPILLLLSQQPDGDFSTADPTPETAAAAIEALSLEQKREILRKVLRSPQFSQSLGSLTQAIRDGGLPMIGEALNLPVRFGGYVKEGGGVPQGGGDAVEAFVEGVKETVVREQSKGAGDGGNETMDTA